MVPDSTMFEKTGLVLMSIFSAASKISGLGSTAKNKNNKLYLKRDDRVDGAGADVSQDYQLVSGLLKK